MGDRLNGDQFGRVADFDPVGLGTKRVREWLAHRHSPEWVAGNVFERGAGHFNPDEEDRGQRHIIMEGSPGWVDDAWVASMDAAGDIDYQGASEQPLPLPRGVGLQPYNDYTLTVYRDRQSRHGPTAEQPAAPVIPFNNRRKK